MADLRNVKPGDIIVVKCPRPYASEGEATFHVRELLVIRVGRKYLYAMAPSWEKYTYTFRLNDGVEGHTHAWQLRAFPSREALFSSLDKDQLETAIALFQVADGKMEPTHG